MLSLRVLVTGAGGQVARALAVTAPAHVELLCLTRAQLDISDPLAVERLVAARAPQVIINAAAYTAVDRAESEPERAAAVNARAPGYLAAAARSLPGCRLVQLSTDYVFDGSSSEPYGPEAVPNPLSVYGRTKLQGEQAVLRTLGERALVLRTAWVYAAEGRNFVLTMLRLMREREAVRVVADQHGAPTCARSIARAIWQGLERPQLAGIVHWTDAGQTSWFEFAGAIAEEALARGLLQRAPRVEAITTADYPTAARRPRHSVLDLRASSAALGLQPTPWREALRSTLAELAGARRPPP